jgi:hypothetical protein
MPDRAERGGNFFKKLLLFVFQTVICLTYAAVRMFSGVVWFETSFLDEWHEGEGEECLPVPDDGTGAS